ncbi:MAG: rhombosortase [Woeseia sp.]
MAFAVPGTAARALLRYDRENIASGEWWRLLTGHFAHLGLSHLLLNAAGLVLIWFLVGGSYGLRAWLFISAVSIAVIDLGFWYLDPRLEWYVGMSGMLHGILAAGLVQLLRQAPVESTLLAVAIAAKLVYEQIAGPLPGSESSAGGSVVVDAHLYGATGGLVAAGLYRSGIVIMARFQGVQR